MRHRDNRRCDHPRSPSRFPTAKPHPNGLVEAAPPLAVRDSQTNRLVNAGKVEGHDEGPADHFWTHRARRGRRSVVDEQRL